MELEDNFADILDKALRGLGLEITELAARAGLPASQAAELFAGRFDEGAARRLAPLLGLDPGRLAAIGREEYRPAEIPAFEGLLQFTTPFDSMTVNSYLAWDPVSARAAAFDTGSDCDGMLAALDKLGLTLETIFLTHSHGDHIHDLDRLKEKTGAPAWISEREPVDGVQTFRPGREFSLGNLPVETRSTWGHSPGGVTYVVRGLARDLAIVGDAIFAGSMGGGGVSYADALKTNRAGILTLAEATVICPGHGPMTTVGEQRRVNPFFPQP